MDLRTCDVACPWNSEGAVPPRRLAPALRRPPRRKSAKPTCSCGAVAQLVERLLCKEEVRSSSLLGSTRRRRVGVREGPKWRQLAISTYHLRSAPALGRSGGPRRSRPASTGPFDPAHAHVCSRASSNERVVHLNK